MPRLLHAFLFATVLATPLLSNAAPPVNLRYQVTRVMEWSIAAGLNNVGDVAGTRIRIVNDVDVVQYGFWQTRDGNYRDLDYIYPGAQITIADINNDRAVTGRLAPGDGVTPAFAFLRPYAGTQTVEIAPAPGMSGVTPVTLSNRTSQGGWFVAGTATTSAGEHAFRWSMGDGQPGGTMLDLGTLGGARSDASDVNASGMVAGWAETAAGERHAYRYVNGAMEDLGAAGPASYGNAINEAGTVVGTARNGTWRAMVYRNGEAIDLGDFGGGVNVANDINEDGWIVGHASLPSNYYTGFLYIDGAMIDLNTLIDPSSGWRIGGAMAINDNGDILALGCSPSRCGDFVLTAVPEPANWILLLSAVPVMAVAWRRRRTPAR